MKAFDTDILTQILRGNPAYAERLALIPIAEQALPVLAVEEVLRGRLNTIRQAEAGKAKITIEQPYLFFEQTLKDIRELTVLSYTPAAEAKYQELRKQKLRGSTHDLRIAAICIAHSVTLATRNRRDFEHIPGLAAKNPNLATVRSVHASPALILTDFSRIGLDLTFSWKYRILFVA